MAHPTWLQCLALYIEIHVCGLRFLTEFVTWDFDLRKWVRVKIVIQDGKPCTQYVGEYAEDSQNVTKLLDLAREARKIR